MYENDEIKQILRSEGSWIKYVTDQIKRENKWKLKALHKVHRRRLHQGRVDDVLYVVTHDTLGLKKRKDRIPNIRNALVWFKR